MSFMKKKSLSILKICQSLLVAKKGKGPFIYYVSFLFGHPSPLPKNIYSIESRVSKKRHFLMAKRINIRSLISMY